MAGRARCNARAGRCAEEVSCCFSHQLTPHVGGPAARGQQGTRDASKRLAVRGSGSLVIQVLRSTSEVLLRELPVESGHGAIAVPVPVRRPLGPGRAAGVTGRQGRCESLSDTVNVTVPVTSPELTLALPVPVTVTRCHWQCCSLAATQAQPEAASGSLGHTAHWHTHTHSNLSDVPHCHTQTERGGLGQRL